MTKQNKHVQVTIRASFVKKLINLTSRDGSTYEMQRISLPPTIQLHESLDKESIKSFLVYPSQLFSIPGDDEHVRLDLPSDRPVRVTAYNHKTGETTEPITVTAVELAQAIENNEESVVEIVISKKLVLEPDDTHRAWRVSIPDGVTLGNEELDAANLRDRSVYIASNSAVDVRPGGENLAGKSVPFKATMPGYFGLTVYAKDRETGEPVKCEAQVRADTLADALAASYEEWKQAQGQAQPETEYEQDVAVEPLEEQDIEF